MGALKSKIYKFYWYLRGCCLFSKGCGWYLRKPYLYCKGELFAFNSRVFFERSTYLLYTRLYPLMSMSPSEDVESLVKRLHRAHIAAVVAHDVPTLEKFDRCRPHP